MLGGVGSAGEKPALTRLGVNGSFSMWNERSRPPDDNTSAPKELPLRQLVNGVIRDVGQGLVP